MAPDRILFIRSFVESARDIARQTDKPLTQVLAEIRNAIFTDELQGGAGQHAGRDIHRRGSKSRRAGGQGGQFEFRDGRRARSDSGAERIIGCLLVDAELSYVA
jgi:hypothetical protein